ncbi:MAG: hypothetical protein RIE52_09695 [Balneola sp.]|jgi:hypothetical protein
MKIIRISLLVLLCLVLLNLITYFLIGKQSLRERNISVMMKTEFENVYDLELEFYLISNLKADLIFNYQNKTYPVYQIHVDKEGNDKFDGNANGVWKREEFRFDVNTVNKILNTDLDSIHQSSSDSTYTLLNNNFNLLLDSAPDSIRTLPFEGKIYRDCEYYYLYKHINCFIIGNTVISFEEGLKVSKPMYVKQHLFVNTVGSDFHFYREEKLIWLFYKWVQIDWIDGNGLGGDATK